jgi:hypothetical protein
MVEAKVAAAAMEGDGIPVVDLPSLCHHDTYGHRAKVPFLVFFPNMLSMMIDACVASWALSLLRMKGWRVGGAMHWDAVALDIDDPSERKKYILQSSTKMFSAVLHFRRSMRTMGDSSMISYGDVFDLLYSVYFQ